MEISAADATMGKPATCVVSMKNEGTWIARPILGTSGINRLKSHILR